MYTVLVSLTLILPSSAAPVERPNVVFILADDLGWSDTTLYGTTRFYQTPNIERLAKRGMTFTRAYSASPLCSPTRASILTGLSPARIGITSPVCHTKAVRLSAAVAKRGLPTDKALVCESATRLKTDYRTLAETLKDAGYATGHFGKWHLGPEPYDPLHQGYDVDVPHWPGPGPAGSYVAPWRFPAFKERVPGEHIEDRMGDEAVAFIEQHKDKPFLLSYWQFSVHAPFDAKAEYIEKHRRRVDPNDPQRSPTYAAMVQSLDENVGKILRTLERLGIDKRTVIILFSDNGGNMYNQIDGTTPTSNVPLRGGKATMYEGGIRVPCIVRWPGVVAPGSRSDAVVQSVDFYPTILEMLQLPAAAQQPFDGISIVPALKGGQLSREAIFTFFPHAPKVPDWLPPAVSVHCGPWKLIRIFHNGANGGHRYELYNLAKDLSESTDLAAQQPERVRQLDALIGRFLSDTGAVLPQPNPDYDPEYEKLAAGGVFPMRDCRVSLREGTLVIESTGNDPHLRFQLREPAEPQPLVVELRMKSAAKGQGQLYWQELKARPTFRRERSVLFTPAHDGQLHDYRIELSPQKPVVSLRLDPAQRPGTIVVHSVRLNDAAGKLLARWPMQ